MSVSGSGKHLLENKFYRIAVAGLGSELQSFFSKELNTELLWQAGDAWKKHAPVLFPVVGQLKNDSVTHDGKTITLARHGFARDRKFELEFQSKDELVFLLKDDAQTFEKYPFRFEFRQKYELSGASLFITLEVKNTGNETLYCSYGAHPAFRVPLNDNEHFEDYVLQFDSQHPELSRYPLQNNLISDLPENINVQNGILPVTRNLFSADALVFKNAFFKSVSLLNPVKGHGVRMHAAAWPYFGIWSGGGGGFICLEPWQGIADTVSANGNLQDKEGILEIMPGKIHSTSYSLEAVHLH